MLVLRDIQKSFGGLRVLNGIDLDVLEGERHAIIGPNGAGKSTLFNLISGGLRPTHGRIVYRGHDLGGLRPHQIARLGLARSFQIINIFPGLTVFENARGAVVSRRGLRWNCWSRLDAIDHVTEQTERVLAELGLEPRRDMLASRLSYGEQRQLEIALTVALQPSLVLLDEPCAGLNADDTRQAVALIRRVTAGRTLLLVEHDMDVVFGLADRVSVIYYGEVLATGAPDEIRANAKVQQAYLARKASMKP
ncbi:MAG TPA: ABC transporter ATP-binding protein [Gaiellales bacterium]|nr:ABC transporter ATP-binding protein [Gaiellales bacterium]